MLLEFEQKLEELGYIQESVSAGFPDLEIDVETGKIRTIPSDPNQINIVRTYKRSNEFFSLAGHDDRSFEIRSWTEDEYDRGPIRRGSFDQDGYPVNSDAWAVAKQLGFVVPKPKDVIERLSTIYEEFNRVGRSLTNPKDGASIRVTQGESTYGDWYGSNGGWSDSFWGGADRDLLSQHTGGVEYNDLYLCAFDMQHAKGRELKTLLEIGKERLPTGKDFYRFHPREAFYVEGELIETGEMNDFVWIILATKF